MCIDFELSSSFWSNLANSCYSQYLIPNPDGTSGSTPRVVRAIGRDGFAGQSTVIYFDVYISSQGAEDLGLTLFNPINFSEACTTSQVGEYCVCQPTPGIIPQPGGSETRRTTLAQEEGTVRPNNQPSLPASIVDPCDEPPVVIPEEPSDTNTFENLSSDCCLRLGAELGWEFIDGVCYWNPPAPTTSTEFGLSENDIIVSDTGCTTLNITGSFYLERPDSVVCEANDGNDIIASLVVYTGDSLENTVIPTNVIQTYSLSSNGYCQWTNLSSTINNDFNTPFKIKLVLDGVKECCEYDIFVDDIQVLCTKQDTVTINNYNACPGYNLKRVVDNKKSWVQNIETPINRVFAPSSDADLPWRYTNYFEQSGVYDICRAPAGALQISIKS